MLIQAPLAPQRSSRALLPPSARTALSTQPCCLSAGPRAAAAGAPWRHPSRIITAAVPAPHSVRAAAAAIDSPGPSLALDGGGSSAGAGGARLADTLLGELFIRALPGPLYYLNSWLMPLSSIFSAWAATHPATLATLLVQPAAQDLGAPSAAMAAAAAALPTLLSFSGVAFVFGISTAMDCLLGNDLRNPAKDEASRLGHNPLYRLVLYAYVPLHLFALTYCAHAACACHLAPLATLGVILSMGVSGTVLFTVAHELVHGSKLDRLLSAVLLSTACYGHWSESHLQHHIKVATPEDPSTARYNETVWAFIPRSVWGNLVDGYTAEARRLAAAGKPLLSLHNRMWWWVAGPLALGASAYAALGWAGLAFLTSFAAVSVFALESVNYIEHYGLTRGHKASGRYERVGPRHSWTSALLYTNAVAIRLMRHADHHETARKHYQTLCNLPGAPTLPYNYQTLILAAMLPPLFFRLMNPLVDQHGRR